ncbi:PDR/VanB family oxidoreductase [Micromonospora sp. NBC_01699]|uniref:PDR/VanB family oxidoreductase n=1 Tax=Micromonospora sp. NBC_01699 TaxID=2975984 RepID=UPI002E34CE26|nr:PDR/VanB family oxidoreductase [Micromonospora sp. NBC_01699]
MTGFLEMDVAEPTAPPDDPLAAMELLVSQVSWESDGVVSIRLVHPDGVPLPPWQPGAHLDVRLPSGTVRQYSLCGDPADDRSYRIAVLREQDGRGGSREVHDTALVGRSVQVRGPRNHFALVPAPSYVFVAGGIGITPILAMVRSVAARGGRWSLFYGGRSRRSMAFVDELRALGSDENLHLLPQDEHGLMPLADLVEHSPPGSAVYCCGPDGMLRAVSEVCAGLGRTADLHLERFGRDTAALVPTDPADNTTFEVELRRSGVVRSVPPDRTLLDVVLDVVPDTAFSCTEGYCGSCETRVLAGVPEHHDQVLSDAERERGEVMMICVGRSRSDRLVLDL